MQPQTTTNHDMGDFATEITRLPATKKLLAAHVLSERATTRSQVLLAARIAELAVYELRREAR